MVSKWPVQGWELTHHHKSKKKKQQQQIHLDALVNQHCRHSGGKQQLITTTQQQDKQQMNKLRPCPLDRG